MYKYITKKEQGQYYVVRKHYVCRFEGKLRDFAMPSRKIPKSSVDRLLFAPPAARKKTEPVKKEFVRATRLGEKLCDVDIMDFHARNQVKKVCDGVLQHNRTGEIIIAKKYELNEETGAIEKKEGTEIGMRNKRSLRTIFVKLRRTIAHNFESNKPNQVAITLTYAENMQDGKQAYKDFEHFYKRLCRAYPEHKFEYLNVCEPQGRGAWHFHLLLQTTNKDVLFIPKEHLTELWGLGQTFIERMKLTDDMGLYFMAYFSDLELDDDVIKEHEISSDDIKERLVNGEKKKFIKGERLNKYPDNMQIWRHSRGIKVPKTETVKLEEISKEYPKVKYEKMFEIEIKDEKKVEGEENEKRTIKIIKQQRKKIHEPLKE